MSSTIETSHTNFVAKCQLIKDGINVLVLVTTKYSKLSDCPYVIRGADVSAKERLIDQILSDYKLDVTSVLTKYYDVKNIDDMTAQYHKKLTSGNYVSRLNGVITSLNNLLNIILKYCEITGRKMLTRKIAKAGRYISAADSIKFPQLVKKLNYKVCNCGAKMMAISETSELLCQNPICGKTKYVPGTIFREDTSMMQEGTKTKHGGYDFNRHYKFWMERLQALEHKNFTQEELSALEYCKNRDRIRDVELRCSHIREYLQETSMTDYNDHAPLLVKLLGGTPPPQFDFQENRDMAIMFNKIIHLYHKVNPDGSNRPYYPYFIYKMVERKFALNPEKLRLLDYIHLQSSDTVKKNDYYYEQICALSAPEDDLVYNATNPYERGNLDL